MGARLGWNLGIASVMLSGVVYGGSPVEPEGFGKVRLGMGIQQIQEIYPDGKLVGDVSKRKVPIEMYEIEGQSIYGLKPCKVGFQLSGNKLYQINFDCGRDQKVLRVLKEQFGEPNVTSYGTFWEGSKTVVSLNANNNVFAFADKALNQEVQRMLLNAIGQLRGQPAPEGATSGEPSGTAPTPEAHP